MNFIGAALRAFGWHKKAPNPRPRYDYNMDAVDIEKAIYYTQNTMFRMEVFRDRARSLKLYLAMGTVEEFVLRLYGEVPGYLWYTSPRTGFHHNDLPAEIWGYQEPSFGDIEVHGKQLRVRNARKVLPGFILHDQKVVLEWVGYHQMFRLFDEKCAPFVFEYFMRYNQPHKDFEEHLQSYRDDLATLLNKQQALQQQ